MTRDQAFDILREALREVAPEIDITAVDPSRLLQEEAEVDSMDFLNLMAALQERCGVEVPERDYAELATLDAMVAYLVAAG